jgi:TPR repeat protein
MNKIFLIILTTLIVSHSNAEDLGACTKTNIPMKEMFNACQSIVNDPTYSKDKQARAAVNAGLINKLQNGDDFESIGWFLIAAEKGRLEGYARIGDVYRTGGKRIKQDFELAKKYYMKDTSESKTKHEGLATMHLEGQSFKKNTQKAIGHYWIALGAYPDPWITTNICRAYSKEEYNFVNLVNAHMWCSMSVKYEDDPRLKAMFESDRLKLAEQMSDQDMKKSTELMQKCVASLYFGSCDIPKFIETDQ